MLRQLLQILALTTVISCCTAAPNLQFKTPVSFETDTLTFGSNLNSVVNGTTSPLVVMGQSLIQSYTDTGRIAGSFGGGSQYNFMETPLMAPDAHGNMLAVVSLYNGSIIALAAETMKLRWVYNPAVTLCDAGAGCAEQGMVFVEPSLSTSCPSGAGGVSFILASNQGDSSMTISVHLVDIQTGASCTTPKKLPTGSGFDDSSTTFQAFPAGGALKRPVIVTAQTDSEHLVVGVDAASGEVLYTIPVNNNAPFSQGFVAGSSPSNDQFAYCYSDNNGNNFVLVASIAEGTVTVQTQLSSNFNMDTSSPGWTATASLPNGISVTGYNKLKDTYELVSYNANDGSAFSTKTLNQTLNAAPVVSINNWVFTVDTGATGSYELVGFPAAGGGRAWSYNLPSVTGMYSSAGPLYAFRKADGSPALAVLDWGFTSDGFLLVFNV